MKRVAAIVLSVVLTLSFVGCSSKDTNKDASSNKQVVNNEKDKSSDKNAVKEENGERVDQNFKEKDTKKFMDVLDNLGNKNFYYFDETGSTIKVLEKADFKKYLEKSYEITAKAMTDVKVDMKNVKVYTYYKNTNGKDKTQKNYAVVFDDNKVPTALYEVIMTVSEKDEPVFKETKKNDKAINDNFKNLFKGEVK